MGRTLVRTKESKANTLRRTLRGNKTIVKVNARTLLKHDHTIARLLWRTVVLLGFSVCKRGNDLVLLEDLFSLGYLFVHGSWQNQG